MNFIKDGLLNVLLYGCGLVVVNGIAFLMLPFYTRQFLPQDYALITLILTCLPFTRSCLSLEICQAAPVFCSDDPARSVQYVSMGFWFTLFMNVVCYFIAYQANLLFHLVHLSSFHLLAIFTLFLVDCLFYYSSNILRWDLKPFLYNTITSGVAIGEVVLTLIFVLGYQFSVIGVVYSWIISRFFGFIFIFFLTRKYYACVLHIKTIKDMLTFSFPLVLSNIPYNLNRGLDRWIIGRFIGLPAVGIYGAGSVIGGVINFMMASFSAALTPIIYKNHTKKETPEGVVKLFYLVLILCALVAIFFALFNKEILRVLVAPIYYAQLADQPIVPIFVLAAIFSGLYIFSPGLYVKRKTSYVILCNVVSLGVNCLLSLALVSKYGILGVAFATCVSILVNALIYMACGQRYYPLPFRWGFFSCLIVSLLMFYAGGIALGMRYAPFSSDGLFVRLFYYLIISLSSAGLLWKIYAPSFRLAEKKSSLIIDKV